MEERKWEDLDMDCLVNVFEKVGMESLLLDVPFVCKSWYKATLNPLCWRTLVFPKEMDTIIKRLSNEYRLKKLHLINQLVKFVVNRGDKCVVSLVLPNYCTPATLNYVADRCPALKYLEMHSISIWSYITVLPGLICKWKNLEMIKFESIVVVEEMVTQVSLHCNNFVGFDILGACIDEKEASAIATLLPNIKHLELRNAVLPRSYLVMILQGCKKLVHFDVRDGICFRVDDEILELASHIPTFKYGRSRV